MNIYIKKTILSLTILALAMSCNEDDTNDVTTVPYTPVNVTLTVDDNNVVVSENSLSDTQTYTITASISEPQNLDYLVKIEQSAGDAVAGVDFTFDDHITISRGTTSATGTITVMKTGDIENDETFSLTAKSYNDYFTVSNFSFNAIIADDYINDVLDLTLSWDGEFVNGDVTLNSICNIDYDLLIADSTGAINYIAGTTACPEVGSISGLADGTYYLLGDLYENPNSGLGFTDAIPLTLSYSQEYFETSGTVVNTTQNLSMPGATDGSFLVGIALLEVSGGYNYTVTPL